MRVNSFSSCIWTDENRRRRDGWEGSSPETSCHQDPPHSHSSLHRYTRAYGELESDTATRATIELTKSLRLKAGPVLHILSTSWMLLVRSLGTGSPVDPLRSARPPGRFAASFVNGECIVQGENGRGKAVSNGEGTNRDRLIYPSGYIEMGGVFGIELSVNSRVSLPVGEIRARGGSAQRPRTLKSS